LIFLFWRKGISQIIQVPGYLRFGCNLGERLSVIYSGHRCAVIVWYGPEYLFMNALFRVMQRNLRFCQITINNNPDPFFRKKTQITN